MREYRYSLGLLELATGICLMILAACLTWIQTSDVSLPLGLLPAFAATPILFWLTTKVQERFPSNAELAVHTYSRPATLVALGVFLLLPYAQFIFMPDVQSGGPTFAAGLVSSGIILIGGTGARTAYLVSGTLLLGLGLALYAPPSHATAIFGIIVSLVLIPAGIVTLRRELRR